MIDLTAHTTFRLPFQAQSVVELRDLESAPRQLAQIQSPTVVLSGGSNWLQLATPFQGTVIRPRLSHVQATSVGTAVDVRIGAGMGWHQFVMQSLKAGWYGLENLALIPGWVGAAPIQNIGAYGVELASVCTGVLAWDFKAKAMVTLSREACEFGYRDSVFKRDLSRYCILEVHLRLQQKGTTTVDYGAIRSAIEAAGGDLSCPQDVAAAVIAIRQSKLPDPDLIPNVGSFFKNPVVTQKQCERLLALHPELPHFPDSQGVKIAAGFLLDKAGWRGRWMGSVGVHTEQALVLVNQGAPSVDDLRALVRTIRAEIQARYDLSLEIEPTQVGDTLG